MLNPNFDPSKFSLGGITRPILVVSFALFSSGYHILSKERIIGIVLLILAIISLFAWFYVYMDLLRKDPNKLRSEKHEQRMKEIEKSGSASD